MLKRSIILLFFLFCFIQTAGVAHAETDKSCAGVTPLISDKTKKAMDDTKDDATLTDKFIIGQTQNLVNAGPINSVSNLVFGNPYCVWASGAKMSPDGIFTTDERTKIIDPVFNMLGTVYATIITLAVLISALRLGFKAYSPQSRADFWQDVTYWVLSAVFLACFTDITDILFGLNTAIVSTFYGMLGGKADGVSIIASWKDGFAVGYIFTLLAEWILALILNIIYLARKITILLLMIMGVVAAVSLLFSKSRYFFGVWLKELIGNIFIQSIHAIILYSFAMMASTGAGMVMKLGMMIMFIPLTGMISKWLNLGDSSTKLGQTLTMTGMAGVAGAFMLAKQSSSVMRGGGRGGDAGMTSDSPSLTGSGGGADTGATSISAVGSGINSSGYQTTKNLFGKAGGAVGAVAGSVAGPAGVAVGMKVGNMAAQGLVQAGRNAYGLFEGSKSTVKDMREFANSKDENGNIRGFKANWTNLEQRRKMMGNIGESIGSGFSMGGTKAGTIGRNLSQMASGVSQKRILETPKEDGGLGGPVNVEQLQAMHGGKEAVWVQNRDHSYFALKDEEGGIGQRISTYGAGDTTLAKGEERYRDYEIGTPAFDGPYQEATQSLPGTSPVEQEGVKPGKTGSSFNLQARSDVYIKKDGQTLKDTRMPESKLNPDGYFAHATLQGKERSFTERGADLTKSAVDSTREGAQMAGIGIRRTGQEMIQGAQNIGTTIGTGFKQGTEKIKQSWNEGDAWAQSIEEQKDEQRGRGFL